MADCLKGFTAQSFIFHSVIQSFTHFLTYHRQAARHTDGLTGDEIGIVAG